MKDKEIFYRYDAFISYRHGEFDGRAAEVLHKELEKYSVPSELRKLGMPERITRVFRDMEELPSSPSLTSNITEALEQSRFLIVVCSPRTPQSNWVMREIEYFKSLGRDDRILALLIEGEPDESFPEPLKKLRRYEIDESGNKVVAEDDCEPLAADIRIYRQEKAIDEIKSLRCLKRSEKLRLIAPILGCGYDELYRRQERALKRKRMIMVASFMTFFIAISSLTYILWQRWSVYNRSLAASEVIDNISSVYSRYEILLTIYTSILRDEDIWEKQLKTAPSLAQMSIPDRMRQFSEQRAMELKSVVKDYPIRWESSSVKNIKFTGSKQDMDSFLKQLRVVENKWDDILNSLYSASKVSSNYDAVTISQDKIKNDMEGYFNNSEIAFKLALAVLDDLEYDELVKIAENKADLKKPAEDNVKELIKKEEMRVQEKERIVESSKKQLDSAVSSMSTIEEMLSINDSDSEEKVAAKARSLRDLGRYDDAVKAYNKYEELFYQKDPTAKGFASAARIFTLSQKDLGVRGGLFIYQFAEISSAKQAGLMVGDIIVKYDGKLVDSPETLSSVMKNMENKSTVELVFLRQDSAGKLQAKTIRIPSGKLGTGLMAI